MAKTVIGLFNSFSDAERVFQEFQRENLPLNETSLLANNVKNELGGYGRETQGSSGGFGGARASAGPATASLSTHLARGGMHTLPGLGQVFVAGPLASSDFKGGNLIDSLTRLGVPTQDAQYYLEGVRRGGALIVSIQEDRLAERALRIMQSRGSIDIHERASHWKQRGFTAFDQKSKPFTAEQIDQERAFFRGGSFQEGQVAMPVVEEQVRIGKQEVDKGGVRVSSHVVETPVREQVNLREERVTVERHPVNRPVGQVGDTAFQEGVLEVRETAEQAVVAKQARVVEEVVVRKDVREHAEQVQDTVRRTDVDVERIGAQGGTTRGFDSHAVDFRTHYNSRYASQGRDYRDYEPAYRYGFDLASDQRYQGRDWNGIEANVRRDWEGRNSGSSWEQVKDAVRYGWDRVRGRA